MMLLPRERMSDVFLMSMCFGARLHHPGVEGSYQVVDAAGAAVPKVPKPD